MARQGFWRIAPLSLILVSTFVTGAAEEISFNWDVRPILSANCFSCHGPDKKEPKAKLRLYTREGALSDLGGVPALQPGTAHDLRKGTAKSPGEDWVPIMVAEHWALLIDDVSLEKPFCLLSLPERT